MAKHQPFHGERWMASLVCTIFPFPVKLSLSQFLSSLTFTLWILSPTPLRRTKWLCGAYLSVEVKPWHPCVHDIVTYCLVGYRWLKMESKIAVLNVRVHINLNKICLNVSLLVKNLPESKIVTVIKIISRMCKWATDDSWWLHVVAVTVVFISQFLCDSCYNQTYRNMHLLKYHWPYLFSYRNFPLKMT